jgi:hypothetical protein
MSCVNFFSFDALDREFQAAKFEREWPKLVALSSIRETLAEQLQTERIETCVN